VLTSLTNKNINNPSPSRHMSTPAHSIASSPPPTYEMELALCLQGFATTQPCIVPACITTTISNLEVAGFSPEMICDASAEHTQELTSFLEGQVLALWKFCAKWVGRMERKHQKVVAH